MARQNVPVKSNIRTHEGAPARRIDSKEQLKRSVMACMLWENSFYESGEDIAGRIKTLVHECPADFVADLAEEARTAMKLRHVPLLLVRELARHKDRDRITLSGVLDNVIQRADELTEFLAIYWKDGKEKLSAQVKKGLAQAFTKFSAYDLAKYNRSDAIKLRDVLFLCHAKPISKEQDEVWKQLIAGTLPIPDTWEVALSAGGDKRETWLRLLSEKKLGALALLRNLRNMDEAKVPGKDISIALKNINVERVLPFRFISAARIMPAFEPDLEEGMLKCLASQEKMTGHTALLIDVSGSMDGKISSKSDITRLDAACGLAILLREICTQVSVFAFSDDMACVPPRRGFALRDSILRAVPRSGTQLGAAIKYLNGNVNYDRIIVISDEQSADVVPNPTAKGYMINIATDKNGVGYGPWVNISGFSEAIVSYIQVKEKADLQ